MTPAPNRGGRPAVVSRDDILALGRELGMDRLSLSAVAASLGVSTTALYRHLDGRWELERLVGESILAELHVADDPEHGAERHLLHFARRLHDHTLAHPGLGAYLQALFPRGEEGIRLLSTEIEALVRRGYAADAATALVGAVATLTISLSAAQQRDELAREAREGFTEERTSAVARLRADPLLDHAHATLPEVTSSEYVLMLLRASVRGLLQVAPPDRPLAAVLAELHPNEED